jgi:hypothetical protein
MINLSNKIIIITLTKIHKIIPNKPEEIAVLKDISPFTFLKKIK